MTRSRVAALAVAAISVLGVTANATPASAGAPILGPNQVTTGDHVPWGEVGHGWYLTLIDQGRTGDYGIVADHQLLDLVDPLGGRYQLAKTDVRHGTGYRTLVDWSTDGRTALEIVDLGTRRSRAVVYDLPAGTHRTLDLTANVGGAGLGPDGSLYVTHYAGRSGQPFLRRTADGATRVLRRHTDGDPLTTPDARRVVIGTSRIQDHRLLLLRADGALVRALPTPAKCQASRWWRPGVVMASCRWHLGSTRLYAVPVDGSRGHWLTADHGRRSADLGDLDARRLHGTTYLEAAGPCGVVFLARQHGDGAATRVHVPRATANVYLLGTRGRSLVLQTGVSCDGGPSRDAITHFDPTTGRNHVVAELPVGEAYATVLGLAERRVAIG